MAVELAAALTGDVVVIATGEGRDEEMAERIRRHREERPSGWATVEEPVDLEGAIAAMPEGACVLLDCLTLWVSNMMERGRSDVEILDRAAKAASAVSARPAPCVAVTNEVGSGIVPVDPIARRFADLLGRVNTIWAQEAERALLMVAGRALPLPRPADVLLERRRG
jgi:adenosylcobinamide kinase/adenosylcobinamide-phosphate guanylyltransferase